MTSIFASIRSIFRCAPLWLGIALGFFGTVVQIVLVREFLVVRGASELSLGIVFCAWLLAIALGAWSGKKWGTTVWRLQAAVMLVLILVPAALLFVRFYEFWFSLPPGDIITTPQLILLSSVCTLPCAGVVGYMFTGAANLWTARKLPSVNQLYLSEGVGAAAAGMLFPFVLYPLLSPIPIVLTATAGLAVALIAFHPKNQRLRTIILPLVAITMGMTAQLLQLDARSFKAVFHRQTERGALQHCIETHYNRICIGKNQEQYQLYAGGELQYVFPDPYERPVPIYVALAQVSHPTKALVIGGGIPNRLDALLDFNLSEIVFFEADKQSQDAATPFFDSSTSSNMNLPQVHRRYGSARSFLKTHPAHFDVILDFTVPVHTASDHSYHTDAYFTRVREALSPNGVYVQVLEGSANVFSPPAATLLANEQATLRAVFSHVQLLSGVTSYWIASEHPLLQTATQVNHRLSMYLGDRARLVPTDELYSEIKSRQISAQLARYSGRVNHDDQPSGLIHSLRLRRVAREAGLGQSPAPSTVSPLWMKHFSVAIVLLFVIGVVLLPRSAANASAQGVLSIATTGMCAMGLELILLYLFSAQWGGLYHHVAGLLAAFMAGISLGAALGQTIAARPFASSFADALVIGTLGATALLFQFTELSKWSFLGLMALSGLVTGLAFPVFLQRIAQNNIHSAPWKIESADHIGAALGAITVSLIWLPQLGVTWTCVLLLFFKVPLLIKLLSKKNL